MEKAEFVNEGPIKIKIFNVTDLDMVVIYSYNESENIYQVERENLDMKVKLFGATVSAKEIYEFSNYRKIN